MKIKLLLTSLLLSIFYLLQSQVPQGFNYQAVARDPLTGFSITGSPMKVQLTIQTDSFPGPGTILWQETHNVTTNSFGLINVIIGKGTRVSGAASFNQVDWTAWPKYFIKTEIEYPLGSPPYKLMGVSRLWSVPFAMIAGDFDGPVKKLAVKGETASLEEPLFEVKNKDGQTVFAVYNEGVRVYVADGAKGLKGGFAVGGFGTDKAGESTKYLMVSKDSVRIYLDTNPLTKKLKGGFAVGGYDLTKGTVQDYLDVSPDSVRIYIDDKGKAKKGGFAVGGYDITKGLNNEYLRVTKDSSRVYLQDSLGLGFAVKNIQGGRFDDLMQLRTHNYFIGFRSGFKTQDELYGYNLFLGYNSGYQNTSGRSNVYLGHFSGYWNSSGYENVFIGNNAGYLPATGSGNINIGSYSGGSSGSDNIYIGSSLGGWKHNGNLNVSIGSNSGYYITGSHELVIHSDYLDFPASQVPLIYGRFDLMQLKLNGDVTIKGKEAFSGSSLQIIGNASKGSLLISPDQDDQSLSNAELILAEEKYATYRMGIQYNGSLNQLQIYGAFSSTVYGPHLVINRNNGYVGLGTTSPTERLMISGTNSKIYLNSAASNAILFNNNGTAPPSFTTRSVGTKIVLFQQLSATNADYAFGIDASTLWYSIPQAVSSASHKFYAGTTELMRIRGDGNVGIGTTNPSYRLQVGNAADGSQARANAWNLLSDASLKTGFTKPENSLEMINGINGYYFYWNMGSDKTKQFGFSAQEVEKVLPEIVSKGEDGMLSLDYGKVTPLLVEAIKDQQKQIESQQKEIDELKALVNSLVINQTAQMNK